MTLQAAPANRAFVIVSIMLATFMVAVEATIVATAMPHIVGQLGGFNYYSWVFSAFLLAQSTTTMIYGKLADVFGRKPTLMLGILIFLVGSLLCGLANSMVMLVIFRLIQGLGAGAIQPITITLIGDLYTLEQRGKVQGTIASVWAISGVLGPLVGGLVVATLPWAWVFWVNLPIGALTIAGFILFLPEKVERRQVRIDYPGALLFSVAVVSLLLILTEFDAGALFLGGFGALFLLAGGAFIAWEMHTPEPLISLKLWRQRLMATSNLATLFTGVVLIGMSTVLPIYVQGVMGRSPITAGFALTMLVIGWPLAVAIVTRQFHRFKIRHLLLTGGVLLPIGAALLMFLHPGGSPVLAGIGSFFIGCGMGVISIIAIVLVQESVEWSMRGSATASLVFSRSLGSTLGATTMAAILNAGILHYGSGALAGSVHALLNTPTGLTDLAATPAVRGVFDHALHWTFIGMFIVAILTFLTSWLIPVQHRRDSGTRPTADLKQAASH